MVTLDQAGWLRSRADVRPAPLSISAHVEHAFTLDFREADEPDWRVLPDTHAHLLVHFAADANTQPKVRASLVGARSVSVSVDVSDREWTVGLRLRPGALPALSGAAASELTDSSASFFDVWGSPGAELVDRFAQLREPEAVHAELLSFVERRLATAREPDWRARALEHAVEAERGVRVGAIARRIGVAPRTLRARAPEMVGLTPKRFTRIGRVFKALRSVLHDAEPGTPRSWSRIALRSGFSDHPHLAREFRTLLGETPCAFLARRDRMPIRSSAPEPMRSILS